MHLGNALEHLVTDIKALSWVREVTREEMDAGAIDYRVTVFIEDEVVREPASIGRVNVITPITLELEASPPATQADMIAKIEDLIATALADPTQGANALWTDVPAWTIEKAGIDGGLAKITARVCVQMED